MKQADLDKLIEAMSTLMQSTVLLGKTQEASVEKLVKSNSEWVEKIVKLGFQLQHMDTLVSNVHTRLGALENQMMFNKEAIASLAKIQAQQKLPPAEPEVTLTVPLSQAAQILSPPSSEPHGYPVSAYLGEGIIDSDTAKLLKNPKDPTALSAAEKASASILPSGGNIGGKINAIKLYRERTGLGLKEAKDAVEAWLNTQPAIQKLSDLTLAT